MTRQTYYELRCLDCGNDGSETGRSDILRPITNKGFMVTVTAEEDYLLNGTGEFHEGGFNYSRVRYRWRSLRCRNCGSTNVQRKRRYGERP